MFGRRGTVSLATVVNVLTIVVLLLAGALAVDALSRRSRTRAVEARPTVASLVGQSLDSIMVVDAQGRPTPLETRGTPSVVYIFSTKCPACEQQYATIASELASLPQGSVVTGSAEPRAVTADYWKRSGVDLPAPVAFLPESLRRYELKYTPTLLILDGSGILRNGLVGSDPAMRHGRLAKVFQAVTR